MSACAALAMQPSSEPRRALPETCVSTPTDPCRRLVLCRAARPDLQKAFWPLGERLLTVRRANHPGRRIRVLNLLLHEPGIIFASTMIRGLIGEDEERDAGVTPFTLHNLAFDQAPGWG
jgi:hypothetical protein